MPRLLRAVAGVLRRLRMRDPGEYGVEIGMSAYLGGQLLAKHNDDKHRDRLLSFSYYFHRQPRRFPAASCCSTTKAPPPSRESNRCTTASSCFPPGASIRSPPSTATTASPTHVSPCTAGCNHARAAPRRHKPRTPMTHGRPALARQLQRGAAAPARRRRSATPPPIAEPRPRLRAGSDPPSGGMRAGPRHSASGIPRSSVRIGVQADR